MSTAILTLIPGIFRHVTCRNNVYPRTQTLRFPVPDDFVFWTMPYNDYMPPIYTASHIRGQSWADPDIGAPLFKPRWNFQDRDVNRLSHMGKYQIDSSGYPLNPIGRTGLRGRGLLGRWGPNHAADPIVTRWKRDKNGSVIKHNVSEKNILQMITIQRHDNRMWAIPGGMVDPGEKITTTLKREFMEEALNSSGGGQITK
ncbi:hypothetical protein GQX74_003481 [Glossina fuscipes]|nr:hypothetical protein GQX74_003481 [Glossina fuscipes]